MKIETINGFTTVIYDQFETMWDETIWTSHLVAVHLPRHGNHYHIVKSRYSYGDMTKTMFTQEEFSQLKDKLVETYGVKQVALKWYNIRDSYGNTGWQANSRHYWQSGTPRNFRYFPVLKDDRIIWVNHSSASFKIPSTFLNHQVAEMKRACQLCEDTFDNDIHTL